MADGGHARSGEAAKRQARAKVLGNMTFHEFLKLEKPRMCQLYELAAQNSRNNGREFAELCRDMRQWVMRYFLIHSYGRCGVIRQPAMLDADCAAWAEYFVDLEDLRAFGLAFNEYHRRPGMPPKPEAIRILMPQDAFMRSLPPHLAQARDQRELSGRGGSGRTPGLGRALFEKFMASRNNAISFSRGKAEVGGQGDRERAESIFHQ